MSKNQKGKPKARAPKAVFRQDWSIGQAAAEADGQLLQNCFVDNGLVGQLLNTDDNSSIVLGRVGAGKSALLRHIEDTQPRVVRIDPSLFSIKYICNSSALEFVSELGVKLDPVFQALWKHVLCVEYIRLRFNIKTQSDAKKIWNQITNFLSFNDAKRAAYEYFKEFGGVEFWQTTEVRLKEIDTKLERELTSQLNISHELIRAGATGARKLSEAQRLEVVNNAKTFINNIHMAALQNVVTALADMDQSNHGAKYFIIIDDLDTDWANTETRHRLIRALIETIRRFRPIRQLKIIVAMRTDLLESVVESTRDAGLQIEKLEDFFLRVAWTEGELREVVEKRINHALKQRYTRQSVAFLDVFPREVRQKPTLDYMLERTLRRPRDVILFVNECFKAASGRTEMSPNLIQDAYRTYSANRRVSLLEEWHDVYPDLDLHLDMLAGLRARTAVASIPLASVNHQTLKYVSRDKSHDEVTRAFISLADKQGDSASVAQALGALRPLLSALFKVGAIGFIRPPAGAVIFAGNQPSGFSESAIDLDTTVVIHPMLYAALGVNAAVAS